MKKCLTAFCFIVIMLIPFFSGCSEENTAIQLNDELKRVEHIGEVPDELKNVVENDLFRYAVAFDGRLLKSKICSRDEEKRSIDWQVQMIDAYGNNMATYSFSFDDAYHITTITATDDGGFLFVLGFEGYAYDDKTLASDNGFASRVVKCDKNGNVQFETLFSGIEGSALTYCFEKDGFFYLFGDFQTPETKIRGVHSPTDIFMVTLDSNGYVLNKQYIAGSDYDSLLWVEMKDDSFVLSVRSQSDDVDFTGSNSNGYPVYWRMTINKHLELTEKKIESEGYHLTYNDIIGEKDGSPIYRNSILLDSFDSENSGSPIAFIDYDAYYLLVSVNRTGIYENTPTEISSIWYYTETVYTAYDYSGNLIFRTSVDSSPDYDAMAKAYMAE